MEVTGQMTNTNTLLALPDDVIAPLKGDVRTRLIQYLVRWHYAEALLRYVAIWRTAQPDLATLREAHARALVGAGRPAEALPLLEALDAERGQTQSRQTLRLRAFCDLGDTAALRAFAPRPPAQTALFASDWFAYGNACRALRDYATAAEAYAVLTARAPDAAPLRQLALLALAQGDAETAHGHLDALFVRNADRLPAVEDLFLLRDVSEQRTDMSALEAVNAHLAEREQAERQSLESALGYDADAAIDVVNAIAPSPVAVTTPTLSASGAVLPPTAHDALRDVFGLPSFRPYQEEVIAHALAGESVLAVMPTGAGKSLTYQLPALLLPHATLVVSPLIALMKDQIENLPPELAECATAINSSLTGAEMRERMAGIGSGQYKLIYVAPERLRQRPFLHAVARAGISLFVVDEAHCVSLWGQSFRPDYLFLRAALDELGSPPVLALTATASVETQGEITERLGIPRRVVAPVFRPNLRFEVVQTANKQEKEQAVVALCKEIAGPIIVYARAREACERLAAHLRQKGVQAMHYHAQTPDRARVQDQFMNGAVRVLVATVAFGMGVDKADVRGIVHFNLPQSVEAYYQEAGRAGRDGQPARCVLLYATADKGQMTTWLHQEAITREDLRRLYRALRAIVPGQYGIVPSDRLQHVADRPDNETFTRVGVSMLERVGLLRRHFDVPRTASFTVRSDGRDDPLLRDIIAASGITYGETGEIDLLALAADVGQEPSALDADLLRRADAGTLWYRSGDRAPLIEMLPAPPDVAQRIDDLLREYAVAQDTRIEAMAAYARAKACRHRVLAGHFGQRLPACGTVCDICAPRRGIQIVVRPQVTSRPDDDRPAAQRVLAGVMAMPYAVGRRSLAQVLTGASSSRVAPERCAEFGALADHSIKGVEEIIDHLTADGYLFRDETAEYPVITLAPQGRDAARDPADLPAWAHERLAPRTRRERTRIAASDDFGDANDDGDVDTDLLRRLKEWRTGKAREAGLPAYRILWNSTLEGIARVQPQSLDALRRVKGMNAKTTELYGEDVLALLTT